MEMFNEFGEVPSYLDDKYRVHKNYGIQESQMYGQVPPAKIASFAQLPASVQANLINMAQQPAVADMIANSQGVTGNQNGNQNGNGNGNGNGQKGFLASYYGGWKLFTLVPLAGILYYLRNKNEKKGMRIGKAVGASAIYAPYLVYAVGKSIYDVAKK